MILKLLGFSFAMLLAFTSGNPEIKDGFIGNPEPSGAWKMVKNDEGVQTYFRWVTKDDGTEYRERKGEVIAACTVQEALQMISNSESIKKWMANIEEHYNLEYVSADKWVNYTLFNIPWPFSNRDLVSLYQLNTDPVKKTVTLIISCKDTYIPLKKGITRLTDYHAKWSLVKNGEQSTCISMTMSSSTPPLFPRYIQDPIIEKVFHGNLVRLKKALED
jgi:hypothetical protein